MFPIPPSNYGAVVVRDGRIVATHISSEPKAELVERFTKKGFELTDENEVARKAARQIIEYHFGARRYFDVPVDFSHRTPFAQKVYEELMKVGYGETVTYGELAKAAGSPEAARAIGRLMATNELGPIVPCHRVVGAGGTLTGFSAQGGTKTKQKMLEQEGVKVEKGKVRFPYTED